MWLRIGSVTNMLRRFRLDFGFLTIEIHWKSDFVSGIPVPISQSTFETSVT